MLPGPRTGLGCPRLETFDNRAGFDRAPCLGAKNLTRSSSASVLFDLTPLETISSLRGIGRYVRGLASGLAELAAERAMQLEGVAATPDLKQLFLVEDPFAYCHRPVTSPVPNSPKRRDQLIARQMAAFACARSGLLHLADPRGMPEPRVAFTVTCHDLIPLVLHHAYLPRVPYWTKLYAARERERYRRPRRILAVSHATKRDLCERLDVEAARVDVVWHGVDHHVFHPRAVPNERALVDEIVGCSGPYVFYLGAGDARKDLGTLLAAFVQSGLHREARLVLAGELGAKRTRQLKARARKLGVTDAVRFAGYVQEEHVPALYRQAAVHAFLSQYEGFGLPVLEGMACGAPTITNSGSSLDEVAGDAALVVPCGDQEALTEALKSAFFDTARRADLRERGLSRAQTFSWRSCAEQTIAFWQRTSDA